MRVSRMYVSLPLADHQRLTLDDECAHYLRTVLRLRRGAELVVFNGRGGEYPATVAEAHRDGVSIELGAQVAVERESNLQTHLGLGISRSERMDLAIQKAVELGVSRLTPLITERCVVHLDEDRKAQRLRHWEGVVRSACEQCGRNRLPVVMEPVELDTWIGSQQGLRLILHPHGGANLRDLQPPAGTVTLLAGPEGGFSEMESTLAIEAGFTPLRLGPRVLRTETAALAALASIQTVWGDLGHH